MNIYEASRRFHISMDKLRFCEENGLLKSHPNPDGETEYTEQELRRIGVILPLLKAGFELEPLKHYLSLLDGECGDIDGQIRVLRKQRCKLLDVIHDKQQSLDELDYMIETLRKKKKS